MRWRWLSRSLFPLLNTLLMVTGCATVRPDPFQDFTASVQELREGADLALQVNDDANRERFLEAAVSDEQAFQETIFGLELENVEGQPFAWNMERTPLFLASRRFRTGVYSLNSVLVAYSELLRDLAAPTGLSKESFEAKTGDLNANLQGAADALGVQAGRRLSIFSAAAAEAARAYLDSRSRSALRRILSENQANVEELATHFQGAVRIAAQNLWQNYQEALGTLQEGAEGADDDDRRRVVEGMLTLNEEHLTRLDTVEALHAGYGAVPRAHRELIDGVENPKLSAASLQEIRANAKRLRALVRKLEPAAEKDPPPARQE